MPKFIRKAAVIGSGVMGASIAAHLANVGITTYLFDIVPKNILESESRNIVAENAIKRLIKTKPAPVSSPVILQRLIACNLEDDLSKLKEVDWIIEAVIENLDIKKHLFQTVEQYKKPSAIVSSNTSGLSVNQMIENCSLNFKQNFLGIHFFNPPRYLKLVEIIPVNETLHETTQKMKDFLETVLGKGVVICNDTPNFIANRIGTFGIMSTLRAMAKHKFTIGEVDTLTGSLIARPKSATFRTLDVVGLDTFSFVLANAKDRLPDELIFETPESFKQMINKGLLGAKSGHGFYKKVDNEIHEINLNTLNYHVKSLLSDTTYDTAKKIKNKKERLKYLAYSESKVGNFIWDIISSVLVYSANLVGEVADDIISIDQAMKWGFGWDLGPFEVWDAIGLEESFKRLSAEGVKLPDWITTLVNSENKDFYKNVEDNLYFYNGEDYVQDKRPNSHIIIQKNSKKYLQVMKNNGGTLWEIGDDVGLLQFHSPNQAIGLDFIDILGKSITYAEENLKGLVVSAFSKNFCVGANIAMILMEAQDDNYDDIELVIRKFQNVLMKMKYSTVPVVATPFGMTLGGGTELSLHAHALQANFETYMGLVEVGVGVIPGGGGNKELYERYYNSIPDSMNKDLQSIALAAFETIAMAKVSTSAHEAIGLQYLRSTDRITMLQENLVSDAKKLVLELYESAHIPKIKRKLKVPGENGYAAMKLAAQSLLESEKITKHDFKIASKLAFVLAGGKLPYGTEVSEQYLLDIEREAFLSLVGEPKTQARMIHMLQKGKPLRN
ncbi:MAG: 3-hydroxyacyl-CoA dehydrogenase NAD-binding protein [Bacillales bacterium]|nr:3-hydroxyacyl-CoA dehydrogenase NAD-binding protein [Bacillales bacterium]